MSLVAFKRHFYNIVWPIKREELKLFLPMAAMMFCILCNFAALRSIKDSLVMPAIGAEVISFLKLWFVLPSSIIFTIIYAKLSNILKLEYIFYIITSSFLAFFLLFCYVIYPNQHDYHLDIDVINNFVRLYPNLQWFAKIVGKWSYGVMYIIAELWSVVLINLMFWQFANHIFHTEQARRVYPTLSMIGSMGLIFAGSALVNSAAGVNVLDDVSGTVISDADDLLRFHSLLKPVINIIVVLGIIAMALFWFINRLITKQSYWQNQVAHSTESTKTHLSIKESFLLILRSQYIRYISLLIISYGLVINILEGPWKAKIKQLYPSPIEYVNFMGNFNIWLGISSVLITVISSNILRRTKWLVAALSTPLMLFITGSIFFAFVLWANSIESSKSLLYAAIIVGAVQNILSKATKYTLFDASKEMTYIPLSLELRTKGKAAVEVIGAKFGKSLGAFIQSSIFIIFPTFTFEELTIYLLVIFLLMIILWIRNVMKLNVEYERLNH